MIDDEDVQLLVAAEYSALASALADISVDAWDTASLCAGWRIREVVAHLTMATRYDETQFLAELQAAEFDFDRLLNTIAARDANLDVETLLAGLRSDTMQRFTTPDGGSLGALSHVVIHGLDVTVPLGIGRVSSDRSVGLVLDGLTANGAQTRFGGVIEGRTLAATDVVWTWGSGVPLEASGGDLILALTGRAVPAERLRGEPLH
jgi:uncharacterized protein (TIGR03083 family)